MQKPERTDTKRTKKCIFSANRFEEVLYCLENFESVSSSEVTHQLYKSKNQFCNVFSLFIPYFFSF